MSTETETRTQLRKILSKRKLSLRQLALLLKDKIHLNTLYTFNSGFSIEQDKLDVIAEWVEKNQ